MKKPIGSEMLKKGKKAFDDGNTYEASSFFSIAQRLDSQYNKEIASLFYEKAFALLNRSDFFTDDNFTGMNRSYAQQIDYFLNQTRVYDSDVIENDKNNVRLLFYFALREEDAKNVLPAKEYYQKIVRTHKGTQYSNIADKHIAEIEKRENAARRLFYDNFLRLLQKGDNGAIRRAIDGEEWTKKEILLLKGEANRVTIKNLYDGSYSLSFAFNKKYRSKDCKDKDFVDANYYYWDFSKEKAEKKYDELKIEKWITNRYDIGENCKEYEFEPAYNDVTLTLYVPKSFQNDFLIEMKNARWGSSK